MLRNVLKGGKNLRTLPTHFKKKVSYEYKCKLCLGPLFHCKPKKKKIYKLNANKATKSVTLRIKINLT